MMMLREHDQKKRTSQQKSGERSEGRVSAPFLNSVSGIYGTTKKGKYVSEADAIKEG